MNASTTTTEIIPTVAGAGQDSMRTPADGRVLVTGGASGLGAAIVARLRERGATPLVIDRAIPAGDVPSWQVDITDGAATTAAVAAAAAEFGGLDAVVTAAGMDIPGRLVDVPAADWERVIAVNLIGTASIVRAALPALTAAHGRVVTIASSLALTAVSDATAYCASKFGVLGFSRALAAETKGEVGVSTIIPGGMSTHFFDAREERYRPPDDAALNSPANVAAAVEFVLAQPRGCEIRELVVAHELEPTWP